MTTPKQPTLTDEQIDLILAARDAITRLHEWAGLVSAVDALDQLLSDVTQGLRADVDARLGRTR